MSVNTKVLIHEQVNIHPLIKVVFEMCADAARRPIVSTRDDVSLDHGPRRKRGKGNKYHR